MLKVLVGREHCQLMTHTELRQQRVDGSDLDTLLTARSTQLGRLDVVVPIGNQQGKRSKVVDDLLLGPRSRETLQELLQNQAGAEDNARVERSA
jgi:hypothetical protein